MHFQVVLAGNWSQGTGKLRYKSNFSFFFFLLLSLCSPLAPPGAPCHLCISRGVTVGTFYISLANVRAVLNRG